jgi:hypothetical protein
MSLQVFMASNSSTDGDGFMETARLIAGENPPRWLAKHLQRSSPSVFLDGNVHAKQLGRKETRSRLKKYSEAAGLVQREVHDPAILELLVGGEFGPMPDNAGIDTVLEEIRRRADIASSRLDLLATGLDDRLGNLSVSAKLMARERGDAALSDFLEAEEIIGPQPPTTELSAWLKETKRKADSALSSSYLSIKARRSDGGRGRALVPSASRPRAFCGAVILEGWAFFHGEYPPPSNVQVAAAAEEYWRACGGMIDGGWGADRDQAWRRSFKKASEPSLENTREELRRHMKLSSQHNP